MLVILLRFLNIFNNLSHVGILTITDTKYLLLLRNQFNLLIVCEEDLANDWQKIDRTVAVSQGRVTMWFRNEFDRGLLPRIREVTIS